MATKGVATKGKTNRQTDIDQNFIAGILKQMVNSNILLLKNKYWPH